MSRISKSLKHVKLLISSPCMETIPANRENKALLNIAGMGHRFLPRL
jgi:hypothetical protein